MAVKRLYVPRARFDEVSTACARRSTRRGSAPGSTPTPRWGRSTRPASATTSRSSATRRAAPAPRSSRAASTSASILRGQLHAPALVLDPDRSLRIVTEEQFGPALPVIPYDDEEQAIAQANDTWSGLCSSVWSADPDHAMAVAARLRTGVTFFNNHNATAVDERAPFGGFNQSGVGRELGAEGLLAFTETHVMSVPT